LRLEALWDELGQSHDFLLVCAYPLHAFPQHSDGFFFSRVMDGHDGVLPTEDFAGDASAQLRLIAGLQQRAAALDGEVTGRRDAERTLKMRETELADFLENAAVGIHQVDADGVVLWANNAELAMLGYTREEYVGRRITDFYVDASRAQDFIRRLCTGESLDDEHTQLRCKDGTIKHVTIHSNGYFDDGKFVYTRCFTRDVTDRVRLEDELRAKVAQLRELDRRKDEFLAMLGHELRNPLAPVTTAIQLALLRQDDPTKVQRSLEVIDRQVRTMTRLIDDLLDVSRITRGTVELREENVLLSTVVEAAVETSRPLIDERGHRITLDLPATPTRLFADPARIEQVLANLLNNAAKYTEMGGEIHLAAQVEGETLTISVKDNGAGMPKDLSQRVFDLFVQGPDSPSRSHGGLGIGLTLVRRLVELHEGTVRVESDGPGKGSEFIITLPLRTSQLRAASAQSHTPSADARTGSLVLVVDDNRDAANALSELLRELGHSVRTAYDGLSAIEMAMKLRPQLVLLDIGLPEVDGYEVARRLRQRGLSATLVALTGYGEPRHRRQALDAGFDEHITKPVEIERLERLLRHKPLN
ncbi:MAG: ATP-binding protein, partial [Chloroflexota bacterium]|nr:ATP-binding protein [Chloroflexota bacterium]